MTYFPIRRAMRGVMHNRFAEYTVAEWDGPTDYNTRLFVIAFFRLSIAS